MKWRRLLLALLCTSGIVSSHTYAIDPYVLTVAPSTSDVSVDPGKSAELNVTVANQGSEDFNLAVTLAPYSVVNEDYDATYTQLPGRTAVTDWLTLASTAPSTLAAGKYFDAKITINVPADTPPGGYSASLLVETSPLSNQSGVTAAQRIAHIMYITVNGEVKRQGNVVMQSLPWITMNTDKQSVMFLAKNTGGSNEIASTGVVITDIFGRLQLDESRERYVLPGTQRTISYEWQPQGMFGLYRIDRTCELAQSLCQASTAWQLFMSPLFVLLLLMAVGLYTMAMWQRRIHKRQKP